MGSRQIVLVSTAGFSVLNTGIFWREAKTKRLFSQCGIISKFSCWNVFPKNRRNKDNGHYMVFTIFSCLLWRKSKMLLLAFMKSLTNCEIPSSNPIQGACSGFLIAACISCSENLLWSWKLFRKPANNVQCTLEKLDHRSKAKKSRKRHLMQL